MSTPFLMGFSEALVARLIAEGELEIAPGSEAAVVRWLSDALARAKPGSTLISLTSKTLLECDDVIELWADNDRIKELVAELKH